MYEIYEDFQAFMIEVGGLYDGLESKRLREWMMVVILCCRASGRNWNMCVSGDFQGNYSAWAAAFMFFSIIASACVLYFGTYNSENFPGHRRKPALPIELLAMDYWRCGFILRFEASTPSELIGNRRGRRRIMHGDLALDLRRVGERPVPARFQLARYQPVRWVSGILLPESPVGGIGAASRSRLRASRT